MLLLNAVVVLFTRAYFDAQEVQFGVRRDHFGVVLAELALEELARAEDLVPVQVYDFDVFFVIGGLREHLVDLHLPFA